MYLTTMELYRRLEACQEEKQFEVLISYQEVGLSPPWGWVAPYLILTTTSRKSGVERGQQEVGAHREPRRHLQLRERLYSN